jgi:hypothetical protein
MSKSPFYRTGVSKSPLHQEQAARKIAAAAEQKKVDDDAAAEKERLANSPKNPANKNN